jgi:hypothetical protein
VIVVARPVGQLANRLVQYAHFVAYAAETGVTVANPALEDDANHFPAFADDALCRYPAPRVNIPAELRKRAAMAADAALARARLLPLVRAIDVPADEAFDLEEPAFRRVASGSRIVLMAGWDLRAFRAFARHRDELRRVFTPAARHVAAAEAAVARARLSAPVVVGVHRRRTDYARWREGRYLFDDAQYASVMRRTRDLIGQDVAFLVCSDERVPANAFTGLRVHRGPGERFDDLHALALCDRLIGPPSTFSAWASFMGAVPRYQIKDPEDQFGMEAFRVADTG